MKNKKNIMKVILPTEIFIFLLTLILLFREYERKQIVSIQCDISINISTELGGYPPYRPYPKEIKSSKKKKVVIPAKVTKINPLELLCDNIGDNKIKIKNDLFTKQTLPTEYYPNLDFSSFQPFMDYKKVTDSTSPAYSITRSDNAYNDQYGFRRYRTSKDQFTINGQDDYVVALGTFYKEKGTCGSRYLVVTSTGMFTVITGDEKADKDTDEMNMFSRHGEDSDLGSIIEWIVDQDNLYRDIMFTGTVTASPVKAIKGEILYLYKIN